MVALLVENGANLEVRYEEGQTLVEMAIEKGHIDTARLLVEKGAQVDPTSAEILKEHQKKTQ